MNTGPITAGQYCDLVEEGAKLVLDAWRAIPQITDTRVVVSACATLQHSLVQLAFDGETAALFVQKLWAIPNFARFQCPQEKVSQQQQLTGVINQLWRSSYEKRATLGAMIGALVEVQRKCVVTAYGKEAGSEFRRGIEPIVGGDEIGTENLARI
jgi:hypothetical protein